VDSTHVHLSSPNISVNFDETDHLDDLGESVAYARDVEALKHAICNTANTSSLEASKSQIVTDGRERQQDLMKSISLADTSSLETSNSQIVTDGRERQQDLMKPISRADTYSLEVLKSQIVTNVRERQQGLTKPISRDGMSASTQGTFRFRRAVSSNPFEANRLSSEKMFKKKVSSRSPLLDNSSSVELQQTRHVNNHLKHSFSKNSSKHLPYPPLPSFAKHGDPQSLLFDSHPGLSIEERTARNALILYGIHETPNCLDHERLS
jgi:hypothetical protein